MIVVCNKCNTSYQIKKAQLAAQFNKLSCVRCGNVWVMEKPSVELEKPIIGQKEEFSAEDSNETDEVAGRKRLLDRISIGLLAFVLCCAIFASLGLKAYYHSFELVNKYPKLYSYFGVIPAGKIAIKQVTLNKGRYQNNDVLDIETKITNHSDEDVSIPWFKIVYLDSEFKEIDHYFARPSNPFSQGKILARDTVIVSHQLPLHEFGDGQMLLIQIGNKTELSLSKYSKALQIASAQE